MSLTTVFDDVDGSIAMNEGRLVRLAGLPGRVEGPG
jgi:hypothetical protein